MLQRAAKLLSAVSVLLVVSLAPAALAATGSPSIYFAQVSNSIVVGSNVVLQVHVNPAQTPVDTVQVVAAFPADKLSFVGLDTAGSSFNGVVPAQPTATKGTVTFGAADLSGSPVTNDRIVASLIFHAKASGTAVVSLDGSQALSNGAAKSFPTGNVSLALTSGTTASTAVGVSGISVSEVTVNNATVHWHTAVASSSVVNFGQTARYGMAVGSSELVTDHSVKLGAVLAGATAVHYSVSSVAADGQYQASKDQTFTTQGYAVAIAAINKSGKPLSGATVQVGANAAVKAGSDGVAMVADVDSGVQRVTVNGKPQTIVVKSEVGAQAAKIQRFTLVGGSANNAAMWLMLSALGLIVLPLVVLGALWLMAKQRGSKNTL